MSNVFFVLDRIYARVFLRIDGISAIWQFSVPHRMGNQSMFVKMSNE
jgi:hypothetical protein